MLQLRQRPIVRTFGYLSEHMYSSLRILVDIWGQHSSIPHTCCSYSAESARNSVIVHVKHSKFIHRARYALRGD